MSRADIHRFFAVTPVILWPVLAWNLYWLQRSLDAEARSANFLVRILTDGRGRLKLDWIARPERAQPFTLSHNHLPVQEATSLDLRARIWEGLHLCSAHLLARAVRGTTLGALIRAAGFTALPEPEPD